MIDPVMIKIETDQSPTKCLNIASCNSFLDSLQTPADCMDSDLEVANVLSKESDGVNPSPYRPSTVITNFTRGNVQTTTPIIADHMSLHQMAAQGELVLLQQEISMPDRAIDKYDEKGFTPLLWACANGQKSAAELLIMNNASVESRGFNGENSLSLAACYGYHEIVSLLLEKGASINSCDEQGNTALMYAAFNNQNKCASCLLEWGADLTIENEDELSAMDLAVRRGNKAVQQVIEEHMLYLLEGSARDQT
ncbi:ankyrin repeat family A protein 2-like isoform X2 [Tubulanus polymorphus]|uniref:ankyrin repeat family A protein 2-like isoform X2 n=1 Tax=Tubulanus polymorphus TaxID=672921 RepID=UPI003DA5C2BF